MKRNIYRTVVVDQETNEKILERSKMLEQSISNYINNIICQIQMIGFDNYIKVNDLAKQRNMRPGELMNKALSEYFNDACIS